MEVILIERMPNLGNIGDKVKVRDGYARNYLLPQKKALRATKASIELFEAKRAEIEARNAEARAAAEKLAKSVDGAVVTIVRQASDDGRLYGSVTARDISVALQEKKHNVDRNQVELTQVVKEIGIYTVKVILHPEVIVSVKANVARSEAEAAAALAANAKKAKKAEADAAEASDSAEDAAA